MNIKFDSKELQQLLDSNTFRISGYIDGNYVLTDVKAYKILDNKIVLYATENFSIDTKSEVEYCGQTSFKFNCKINLTCTLSISSLISIIEDNHTLNILDKTDYSIGLDMIGSCRWNKLEHAIPDFYAENIDIDQAEFIHALAKELENEKTGKMLDYLIEDIDTEYNRSDSDYYKNIVSDLLDEYDWYQILDILYKPDMHELMSADFEAFVQENYTDKLLEEYQDGTSYYELCDYRTDREDENDKLLLYKA